jgi:uncharacterized membrane protein
MRTTLWLIGGVLLGAIIHIVVVLILPGFATNDIWTRVTALGAFEKVAVLPAVAAGEPNPLGLDPELTYAVCQLDLGKGPGVVSATLPFGYWSVAVFNRAGAVIYSTTNRDGLGQALDLGVFNPAQTRLLAEQQLQIEEGLLIVESPTDAIFVAIRLAPPHQAMRARFETALSQVICGNIEQPAL